MSPCSVDTLNSPLGSCSMPSDPVVDSTMVAPRRLAAAAIALQALEGSTWPSSSVQAPASTPSVVTNGLIRRISSGLMICIRNPMLAATPSTRLKWSSSSWFVAKRMPPDAVPAGGLAGLRLEPRVQVVAVGVDLGQVVVGDEARALAGGVPGGARGQLALLDQDRRRSSPPGRARAAGRCPWRPRPRSRCASRISRLSPRSSGCRAQDTPQPRSHNGYL